MLGVYYCFSAAVTNVSACAHIVSPWNDRVSGLHISPLNSHSETTVNCMGNGIVSSRCEVAI
jgi:hypothetical protein